MTTLWSFALVLSGLILVHELGHFLMARSIGITVLKLSLGFGPRVWGVIRGATDYCISAFPLGGFVKMLGEQPNEPVADDDIPGSFSHRPVWQRAAVVVSGPLSNLAFAWIVFFVIFLAYGNPVLLPDVGEVQPESSAADAGILPGDRIVAIEGMDIHTWDEVSEKIRASEGKSLLMRLERGKHTVSIKVTPQIKKLKNIFGEEVNVPVIGVTAAGNLEVERLNPAEALGHAFSRTWELIVLTGQGFLKIVQRVVPLSTLGGPIMIAQLAGQQAEQGILNLFYFMALLSINLGLLNLLPIPVLDGGHLVFYGIEAVLGRPLTPGQMAMAQRVGLLILGALMLFVFYNDIARLLGVSSATGMP
jgi:regulator of sigma E protease